MKANASVFFGAVLLLASCGSSDGPETRLKGPPVLTPEILAETKTQIDFVRHVKPILEQRCIFCHDGSDKAMPYSLTNRTAAFKGERIVPGKPEQSLLYLAAKGEHKKIAMPVVGFTLHKDEVDVLKRWIELGAIWPSGKAGELRTK